MARNASRPGLKRAAMMLAATGALGASVIAAAPAQAAPVQQAAAPQASVQQAAAQQAVGKRAADRIVWVYVWATNVNVRRGNTGACTDYPSTGNCPIIIRKVSKQEIGVYCQKRGQMVSDSGYSSEWWSYTYNGGDQPSGFVSNVYIRGKAHLDGVPDCAW
ncbi:hypothetical protein [Actinomadura livida]|uniref:SH3 domain-containing protein n=1 Tax=Actinomadura livida TaxID=79909 RepID=A0A7W7I8Y1_9ACTN|nr:MULTISPECIES: hypothetical protein [Actinomadura]MBB4772615.1 hypothetical protein [Actinomadura catellatispora]GGU11638.1 hypothetical protein GCM10010208_40280 [Actinomadura livida]